ncbi:MAG: Rrf2 family transcriptional regulator [Nitrococcus sp.]|nr:Rrf2 family transcriptional regulator [Nitrococcus sp.]
MRLTRYTDYCLRVLMYLGVKGDELATIKEIAERYDISKNHLMKVAYELNRLGYIETIRGKNGGMHLRLAPEQINLGRLVRDTESDLAIVECFATNGHCSITPSCVLKDVLGEALDAFFSVLSQYTLHDLLGPKHDLGLLLGVQQREVRQPHQLR